MIYTSNESRTNIELIGENSFEICLRRIEKVKFPKIHATIFDRIFIDSFGKWYDMNRAWFKTIFQNGNYVCLCAYYVVNSFQMHEEAKNCIFFLKFQQNFIQLKLISYDVFSFWIGPSTFHSFSFNICFIKNQ